MSTLKPNSRTMRGGQGFTLIELLVVIAIITILATFLLAGAYMAQQAARQDRSKAIIARINSMMNARYRSYISRPIPDDMSQIITRHNGMTTKPAGRTLDASKPKDIAYARTLALREMMRMEMPDHGDEVTTAPKMLTARTSVGNYLASKWPTGADSSPQFESAELLYLILTTSTPGADSSRGAFSEYEIGDKDSDGKLEVHDAWGNPISFIRWPLGFTAQSDIQKTTNHDPFDPMNNEPNSYELFPLVYSFGADGYSGLILPKPRYGTNHIQPHAMADQIAANKAIGCPMKNASDYSLSGDELKNIGAYLDNLHNHMLNMRGN